MGSFYTNITVGSLEITRENLIAYLDNAKTYTFVSPGMGTYVIVYDEFGEDALAAEMSRDLQCRTFFVSNHADDFLWYSLFDNGRCIDQYYSWPDYFESPGPRAEPEGGDVQVLCDAFGCPFGTEQVERVLRKSYSQELERHMELAELLHIPIVTVGVGYNYIETGDVPDWMIDVSVLCQTPRKETAFQVPLVDDSNSEESPQRPFVLRGPADLADLTLRSLVAFAARSARRGRARVTVPTGLISPERYFDAIDKAVLCAEQFAAGGTGDERFRNRAAILEDKCRGIVRELQYAPSTGGKTQPLVEAIRSAQCAATTALLSAWGQSPTKTTDFKLTIEHAIKSAYEALQNGVATKSDLTRLREIGRGKNSELGDPIDPSDSGPLGSIE